ncbi:MAG: insulinase family protein [Proteobacteria bacterium]|nr:insulinase family protein [Pseudomonadota bacterium]MBU1711208.1 insulinase family protein [Pseudomonadota bacterium]
MYKKSTLKNGVQIVTERLESRSVSVGICVEVGSRDEGAENNGYAHFVEHMMYKGTARRTPLEIGKELDVLGGMSNGYTTREGTCFYATVLADKLPELLDIFSDIILHSIFSPEEVVRERDVVLQEISMVDDTPDDLIHDLFEGALWGDHSLGQTVLGRREVIEKVDSPGIRQFVKEHYTGDRFVIAAAGQVDHDSFVAAVDKAFSLVSQHSKNTLERTAPVLLPSRRNILHKPLEQQHVVVGTYGLQADAEERYALILLNTVFGGNMSSRLFQEIREKRGLAYSVYSFVSSYVDSGHVGIYLGVDPASTESALAVIAREIDKLRTQPVTPEELANAKDYARASMLLASDNMESRMMRLARNESCLHRFVDLEEVTDAITRVSDAEILELAGRLFGKRHLSAAAIGPLDSGALDKILHQMIED